jgi:hypothetical protein
MSVEKLSPELAAQLASAGPDELIDVIFEMEEPMGEDAGQDRSTRIAARKRTFTEASGPVETLVEDLGGIVVDRAWINRTLRARVPAGQLDALARAEGVRRIDVPRRIEPD